MCSKNCIRCEIEFTAKRCASSCQENKKQKVAEYKNSIVIYNHCGLMTISVKGLDND